MAYGARLVVCCAQTATLGMALNLRAVALLGLLDLDDSLCQTPTGQSHAVEQHGHWRVAHYEEASVWRCLCGRSEPLIVPAAYRKRVRLPNDLVQACEVCRNELAACSSKASRFHAWLERHRPLIDRGAHLEYPEDKGFTYSEDDGQSTRTRRFVYEAFFKTRLGSSDCVSLTCSNPFCINPYHLCVNTARNQKVTPAIKTAIERLQELGISAKTTQQVIAEKFATKLSISTIQGMRAGSKRLLATVD